MSDQGEGLNPAEMAAHAAGQRLDADAAARNERLEGSPGEKQMIDAAAKENLVDTFKLLKPEMTDAERDTKVDSITAIYNRLTDEESPVSEGDYDSLADYLKDLGLRKDAEGHIDEQVVGLFPHLSEQQQRDIISKLPQISAEEEEERGKQIPQEDVDKIKILSKQTEKAREGLMAEISKQKEGETDQERLRQLEGYEGRAGQIESKLKKFFTPEDPAKTWAQRGGKLAGYILLAMFIGLILELHWLHNAAKKN